jgi:hypothetical protein
MKQTGRPRIDPDDYSVSVSVSLPSRQYDQFYRQARRDDISIAEVIRRHLDRPVATRRASDE